MSGALGKPGSKMNLEASSSDAALASQCDYSMHAWTGCRKTCEKERIPEESGDSDSELWYHKRVAQIDEIYG